VQPLPELPASVELVPSELGVTLMVFDISLGGLGLYAMGAKPQHKLGDVVQLRLKLRTEHEVTVLIRHVSADGTVHGVEFSNADAGARAAINRYVSELTERGA
jgi:c-di-GMP-binding flagellar brake protein YcgR